MHERLDKLVQANRLNSISQRIGFALWQIQELEGLAAHHFVLLAQATRGIGEAKGNALLEVAERKTFGMAVRDMERAGLLDERLAARFRSLLAERNWLVHNSRSDSRSAVYSDVAMSKLMRRVQRIADESLELMRELGSRAEQFVMNHGVTQEQIQRGAQQLLAEWRNADAD